MHLPHAVRTKAHSSLPFQQGTPFSSEGIIGREMHDDRLSCGTPHPEPMVVGSAKIFGNLDEVELFIGGGVREAVKLTAK
jgi:hypothetical protein